MPSLTWNSLRASKWFKPAIALGSLLFALATITLALPLLLDINTYREQIVSQLEQRLGRKVSLGKMSLRVLPAVKVTVDDLAISDDPQIAQGAFVRAQSIKLQLGLLNLLRGKPEISGIELVAPNVTLIKTSATQWNWNTLKPLQQNSGAAAQAPFDLLLTNGSFKLIDRSVNPAVETNYSGVNVALDDFSPQRSFAFVLGLTMPGNNAGKLELNGSAGPLNSSDASQTPFNARVKLASVELRDLETLAGSTSDHAGKITLDAQISGKLAEGLNANGELKAERLRLVANVEPARQPVEAKFKLTAKANQQPDWQPDGQSEIALHFDQADIKIGNTAIGIAGQINRLPAAPTFDLQIKGDRMALDSLLESAYAFGFGPPAGTKASGAATISLKITGDTNNFALNGQAEMRDLKFQSAALPQAMQVSELKLTADPQALSFAPFRSTLSQTTVDFRGLKISDYGTAGKAPRAHLEIATNGAQLGDLLKIVESFGARPDATGSGSASLTATIDTTLGAQAGATQINGQGKLSGAQLQPSALKKPLEIANADLAFTGDSARVDNLQAQLGSSQASGWLTVKNLDAPAIGFDLKANQLNVAELQALMNNSQRSSGSPLRAEGQLAAGKLVLDSITATDVQGKVTMANNVITLSPLSLRMYGGSYQGTVRVNQAGGTPDVAINGKFNSLDINQFLAASSGSASSLYGQASGTIDVRGRNEAAGMAQTLNGNGYIAISNGKFASFDLMKQVEVLGKLFNLPTGGAGSAFRSLKTNLRFEHGKLTTNTLQLVMDDMQVSGDGWMQMGDAPVVSYDLLAKLSPALTKRVLPGIGGDSSGGRAPITLGTGMNSVMGNFFMEQGGIVLPIKMSGTLKQPVFGLNAALLQTKLKDRVKEDLQERLIDKFLKKPGEAAPTPANPTDAPKPATKPAEVKPADLLKGVLDKLKKKEKP